MEGKKNILITFDCELFQGRRSGSVANCMLVPTEKILQILNRNKTTGIFFIDMMYLCRLKEAAEKYTAAKNDFEQVEKQLIAMAEGGHYVFNHIHPHWLDAVYDEQKNEWTLLNDSKYAFESLTELERENIFERTMNLLKEILSKASKSFLPDGYRAGGLYIQPVSSFKKYFDKYGIRYEFSVLKNATGELENQNIQFNFSGVEKNIYRFSNDIVREDKSGTYTEFALQFVDVPLVPRLLNSVFYRLFSKKQNHQMHGDGISTSNKIYSTAKNKFSSTETFSVEMLNEIKLPLYLKEAKQNNYLHLLSHPKLVSDYNLQQFDNLLKKLIALGNTEFDFKKFELAEQ